MSCTFGPPFGYSAQFFCGFMLFAFWVSWDPRRTISSFAALLRLGLVACGQCGCDCKVSTLAGLAGTEGTGGD